MQTLPQHVEHVRHTGELPHDAQIQAQDPIGYLAACKAEADRLDQLEADLHHVDGIAAGAVLELVRGRLVAELELVTRRQNLDGTPTGLGDAESPDLTLPDYRAYAQLTQAALNLTQAIATLPEPPVPVEAAPGPVWRTEDTQHLIAHLWQASTNAGGHTAVADAVCDAVRVFLKTHPVTKAAADVTV